jgi:2-amino-4-hydroxy-6-hydroxymethyldihydropteridine diphosphokinase
MELEALMTHTVYIAIGSNLGDKLSNCRKGIELLEKSGITIVTCSHFYKTEPVDYADQDWFINAAVKAETDFAPLQLLKALKSIEKEVGRVETVRFGPRILDMDIIFYDDVIMDDSGLTIPHPRMHKRRFVLTPICDIDADIVHPALKQTMAELLKQSGDDPRQEVIRFAE